MRLAFAVLLKSEHLYLPLNLCGTILPAVISFSLGLSYFFGKMKEKTGFVLFYVHCDYCAIVIIKDEPSKELH